MAQKVTILIIVIALIIIYGGGYILVIRKTKHKKKKAQDTMIQNASYVETMLAMIIEPNGFSNDRYLSKTQVINTLKCRWAVKPRNSTCRLRILCFSDIVIPSLLAEECDRTISLLQTICKLPITIDWVLTKGTKKRNFKSHLHQLNISYGRIYTFSRHIDMTAYDMILHPYSGLNGAYEIIAGLLKQLKEDIEN